MKFPIRTIPGKTSYILGLMALFLVSACGTYTSSQDGIYTSRRPRESQKAPQKRQSPQQVQDQNTYQNYFSKQSAQIARAENYINDTKPVKDSIFTDPDTYSSGNAVNNTPYNAQNKYTENSYPVNGGAANSYNAEPWGSNPTTVNVNYYGGYSNPYLYSGYYGYYNPWGYGGYYASPYYSPFYWGWGWSSFGYEGYPGFYFGFGSPYYYGYPGYYGYYPYYGYLHPYNGWYARNARSYHRGNRNYRSSYALTGRRATKARTATNTRRRSASQTGRNTNKRISTNTRRKIDNKNGRTSTQRRIKTSPKRSVNAGRKSGNNISRRVIRNPKHIRAGSIQANPVRRVIQTRGSRTRPTGSRRATRPTRSSQNIFRNSSKKVKSNRTSTKKSRRKRITPQKTSRRIHTSKSTHFSTPSRSIRSHSVRTSHRSTGRRGGRRR